MTELKCPFCDKPLQPTHRIEDEYFCENYDCPQTSITWVGTSSLWKALANTKKKLDIAVDALKNIGASYPRITDIAMQNKANTALEQIKDKEQQ